MKRILIPTDFSKNAFNAISYARQFWQDDEVTITLLHAYEPTAVQLLGNKSPMRLGIIYESLKKEALQKLEQLTKVMSQSEGSGGHVFSFIAVPGNLKEAIQSVDLVTYDYVVMGSQGATGLREFLLGSTTYSVVNAMLPIPILVIPAMATFTPPIHIGFATDFSRSYSSKEIQPLLDMTQKWKSTIRMVEVYYNPSLSLNQEEHQSELSHHLQNVTHNYHVVPDFSTVEMGITVFNEELAIDVLAMINYPKSMLHKILDEPVLKKMTFHTTIPFLIIPGHS